jgi:phenylacetic acid degradation operon negative regulatory protein
MLLSTRINSVCSSPKSTQRCPIPPLFQSKIVLQGNEAPSLGAHPEAQAREFNVESKTDVFSKTIIFNTILEDNSAAARLVGLGWDLQDLGRRYQDFVMRFERVSAALRSRGVPDPQASFVARTLLIHDYRRLHLRDPLLPPRLLQDDWPGVRAAELCREIYARVFAASEEYLSSVAVQLKGALPPPDRSVMQRFGGIDGIDL